MQYINYFIQNIFTHNGTVHVITSLTIRPQSIYYFKDILCLKKTVNFYFFILREFATFKCSPEPSP